MLVISRKKNESVVIGDNIFVTVVEIRNDKVRLAFVNPKEVSIHRQEVYDAIYGTGKAERQNNSVPAQPEQATVPLADRHIPFVDHLAATLQQATGAPVTRSMVVERILDAVEKAGEGFPWNSETA